MPYLNPGRRLARPRSTPKRAAALPRAAAALLVETFLGSTGRLCGLPPADCSLSVTGTGSTPTVPLPSGGTIGLIRVGFFVWSGGPTPNPLPRGKGLPVAVTIASPGWRQCPGAALAPGHCQGRGRGLGRICPSTKNLPLSGTIGGPSLLPAPAEGKLTACYAPTLSDRAVLHCTLGGEGKMLKPRLPQVNRPFYSRSLQWSRRSA